MYAPSLIGHALQQENKTALLDLLDVLAYPHEDYVGYVGDKEKDKERTADVFAGSVNGR